MGNQIQTVCENLQTPRTKNNKQRRNNIPHNDILAVDWNSPLTEEVEELDKNLVIEVCLLKSWLIAKGTQVADDEMNKTRKGVFYCALSCQTPALDATQAQSGITIHMQDCINHQALGKINQFGDFPFQEQQSLLAIDTANKYMDMLILFEEDNMVFTTNPTHKLENCWATVYRTNLSTEYLMPKASGITELSATLPLSGKFIGWHAELLDALSRIGWDESTRAYDLVMSFGEACLKSAETSISDYGLMGKFVPLLILTEDVLRF